MIQMTLANVQIEYRPLRIGFCVRYGNIQDVVTASRISSILWGGVYNPIIPVGSPDDLANKLVNVFPIDILVPLAETSEIKSFIDKYNWARLPRMYRNSILVKDSYNKGYMKTCVLDISHLLRNLWDKEFKFAKDGTSKCAIVSWKASDPYKDLYPLIFGDYPKEIFSFQYMDSFKKATRAQDINIEPKKNIPALAATVITPIGLTAQLLNSWGGSGLGDGVYVGDHKYFLDVVNFWNIRAAGTYLTFLPKTNSRRFSSYVRSRLSNINSRGYTFKENRTNVSVWFLDETKDDIDEIRDNIKPFVRKDRVFSFRGTSALSWNGLNIMPSYHALGEASCIADIESKYDKPTVTVHLSDKPIQKRERRFREQFFVVSLNTHYATKFPEHTTILPLLPDLNEWYSEQIVYETWGVRAINSIHGSSIGFITNIDVDTISFYPIRKYELIKKILERALISANISGAGLVAKRLIVLMGGINWSARIFKIPGVRKFIHDTNPLRQHTRYEIENRIYDNGSFNRFVREFGLGEMPLTTAQIFDTMLKHNLLRAGIEVRCPKCSLKAWITLNDIDEFYSCDYCQENSKFIEAVEPVKMKDGDEEKTIDGVKWCYRLSGLLEKSDKQQGAIPVILTLQRLDIGMHFIFGNEGIWSTALDLQYEINGKKQNAESDLVVFDISQRASKQDFEILIGECKTGQRITRAQIDRLVEVKKLIEKSGIKCHIVFTKLKGEFINAEIGHFKRLVSSGINPILFTAKELEWWWDEYRSHRTNRSNLELPYEHPLTFDQLAENSVYLYKLSEVKNKNRKSS